LTPRTPTLLAATAAAAIASFAPSHAFAEAMLLIEADSGKVLYGENATYPWYPASVTKLMTAYVTLQAVKSRRLTLDTLLTVSARAHAQQPSKMGFKPGTKVTVDNALKMLMVKSANDVAVVLAEGVSGSVENFADEMNRASKALGMTQSSWVNPNGLPAENQISSARDIAILARAAFKEFPEYDFYWNIPGIKFGKRVMRNYNTLIGRYEGADGIKTGFICASGFNLVASATRNGRRLIAVMLGSPSGAVRAAKTASLLERGFRGNTLAWLAPTLGTVDSLQPINAAPTDLRDEMCGPHRKRPAAEEADDESTTASGPQDSSSPVAFALSNLQPSQPKPSSLLGPAVAYTPIVVFAGPGKKSAETQIAAARGKLKGKASKTAGGAPVPETATAQVASATPGTQFRDAFGPIPSLPTPATTSRPPWMSFAPAAQAAAAPAPLTAAPTPVQIAVVPLPRPRPKLAARKPKVR
jgi:D-alanyl-D-alanine carboxypeptidase